MPPASAQINSYTESNTNIPNAPQEYVPPTISLASSIDDAQATNTAEVPGDQTTSDAIDSLDLSSGEVTTETISENASNEYTYVEQPISDEDTIKSNPTKKILTIFLIVLILLLLGIGLFLLITRLGKQNTTATTSSSISSTNLSLNTNSQPVTTTTTIRIWSMWEPSANMKTVLDNFSAQNPGVKIEFVNKEEESRLTSASYKAQLFERLNSNVGPDIFLYDGDWMEEFKKYLSPMPDSIYTASDFQKVFFQTFTDSLQSSDGKYYGMPYSFDSIGVYYNKTLLKANGYDKPADNWNDFKKQVAALTVYDAKGNLVSSGLSGGNFSNVDFAFETLNTINMQNLKAQKLGLEGTNGYLNLEIQPSYEALRFWYNLTADSSSWNKTLPRDTQLFSEGKLAMMFAPSWRAHGIATVAPNLDFDIAPMPQIPNLSSEDLKLNYSNTWSFGVSAASQNKAIAWTLLKYLTEKDNLQTVFNQASKSRLYGQIYPRRDMVDLYKDSKYIGSFASMAENAKMWNINAKETVMTIFESNIDQIPVVKTLDISQAESTYKLINTALKQLYTATTTSK